MADPNGMGIALEMVGIPLGIHLFVSAIGF